jgi:hypothetical protein
LAPIQVIASSPSEFLGRGKLIGRTFLQSLAFCFFIPLLLRSLISTRRKTFLDFTAACAAFAGIINYFVFSSAYGTMTRSFRFENSHRLLDAFSPLISGVILGGGVLIAGTAFLFKKQKYLILLLRVLCVSSAVLGLFSVFSLYKEPRKPAQSAGGEKREISGPEGFLTLSSTGKNTFFFFIDRAAGVALNKTLEYDPALKLKLDGFTWYPNTLSFANFTVSGLNAVFGGYDYAPLSMAERKSQTLEEKINEAFSLLPKIFGEAGRRVLITDPPIADGRTVPATVFFNRMKNTRAENIEDYFVHRFKEEFPQDDEKPAESFDFDILFRYGLFRIAPPAFRYALYYNGKWWRDGRSNGYERALSTFSTLYYLPEICAVDDGADTLAIFMNETTHEPDAFTSALRPVSGAVQYSAEEKAAFGSDRDISYTYSYRAFMKAVSKWIEYLKENGVYDNTRIIIVSDHGCAYANTRFEEAGMERFNPLLLVKDRNSRGELRISDEFMTNADAALFALKDFSDPVNPFLRTPLNDQAKKGPVTVCETPGNLKDNDPYSFKIIRSRVLQGNDIFKSLWENWGK